MRDAKQIAAGEPKPTRGVYQMTINAYINEKNPALAF